MKEDYETDGVIEQEDEIAPIPIYKVEWCPISDITTYELALAIPLLMRLTIKAQITDYNLSELPDDVLRHFLIEQKNGD